MKKKSGPSSRQNVEKNLIELVQQALVFLPQEQPLLLGVSGGADSVALLHLLLELGYKNLIVCHFNHQLRGQDSDNDAHFVQKLAQQKELLCELGQENIAERAAREGLSLETAAREARYEFFARVAEKHNVKTLLLAHHADDQVETCFFNFLRGTGSAGLAGMLPRSQRTIGTTPITMVRPLLQLSKEALKKYLDQHAIPFCHDASNDSMAPTRNRLRHRLFPLLDELVGRTYRAAILRTATILAEEDDCLEKQAAPWASQARLNIGEMKALPLALQRRVIHAWLRAHHFCDVGFGEVERVISLLNPENAHQINLPGRRHACRQGEEIFIL